MSSAHSPTFPSLHIRHNSFYNPSLALPTSQLILQPFRCFTYVTVSFFNPYVASPTSQFIFQTLRCFTYITVHSPIFPLLHLRHSFSNPSFASPTSEVLHLRHLASRPWFKSRCKIEFFSFNSTVVNVWQYKILLTRCRRGSRSTSWKLVFYNGLQFHSGGGLHLPSLYFMGCSPARLQSGLLLYEPAVSSLLHKYK